MLLTRAWRMNENTAVRADSGSTILQKYEDMASVTSIRNKSYLRAGTSRAKPLECPAMANVLIVDDDDAVRGILLDLLSDRYECNTASTAEEAFQYLEIQSYDAVLTDIAMPGLTGVELLKRIQLKDLATPVILISGKGAEQDPEALIKLGAFAYVNKPFGLDEIELLVARALDRN